MVVVGWFELVVGLAIAGLWIMLVATRQVPELAAGRRDIRFHIGAEVLTALLLVGAGVALLVAGGDVAAVLGALAAGALLYTTVNSAGYYADLGQWAAVGMFAALAVATAGVAVLLLVSTPA